jgi:hypothetical protein
VLPGDADLNNNDPTDYALAAIASLFERPVEASNAATEVKETPARAAADAAELFDDSASVPEVDASAASVAAEMPEIDVDRYARVGPGPLDAIRFRWAARRDEAGRYFVDETIGPYSRPLASGPMPMEDVVAFIDGRARDAQRRFDALKLAMSLDARASGGSRDRG